MTGGAGFIGSNFVRYVLAHYPSANIINLDALTYAGSKENLKDLPNPHSHTLVHGDICDQALVNRLFSDHNIDVVVHFAAESHVDRSITGPAAFIDTNIRGTFCLLEAARKAWIQPEAEDARSFRFHHVSTDEVYGSLLPSDPAFHEKTAYDPSSPYSASKASSDHLVRAYHRTYGLPVSISNCSNNYGPYQYPEKLIPLVMMNALKGKPLPIYGDGKQIRDWLYVEDHCQAIFKVMTEGRPGETYNIGGNNQPTNLEIVDTICQILDDEFPTSPYRPHAQLKTFVTDRPGHDRRYAIDISKVQSELSWTPTHTLESGLQKTIRWYLSNASWLDTISGSGDFSQWIQNNYKARNVS